MEQGFDVIGDIHGFAEPLERLLHELGYHERDGVFRPDDPSRQVVFIGDLVDRGPDQLRTLEIVRTMVDAGTAQVVMGNHEFNAIAWTVEVGPDQWARPHTDKNRKQHAVFLEAVGEGSARHREWVDWFRTIPMWLDLGGLRVVHACWDPVSMAILGDPMVTEKMVQAPRGSDLYEALEVVMKGPEIYLDGRCYRDKDGHERRMARWSWWDPSANSLATGAVMPGGIVECDGTPIGPLPDTPLDASAFPAAPTDVPVLYGHYWRSGATPVIDGPFTACLDWSVAKDGPLVAYRWSGEAELTNDNFVTVPAS